MKKINCVWEKTDIEFVGKEGEAAKRGVEERIKEAREWFIGFLEGKNLPERFSADHAFTDSGLALYGGVYISGKNRIRLYVGRVYKLINGVMYTNRDRWIYTEEITLSNKQAEYLRSLLEAEKKDAWKIYQEQKHMGDSVSSSNHQYCSRVDDVLGVFNSGVVPEDFDPRIMYS